MKVTKHEKVAVVNPDDVNDFENEFNARVEEIGDRIVSKEIKIFPDKIIGVIVYLVVTESIDSVADEFHLAGVRYLCKHCPHLDDPKDKRIKRCTCKYAELGMTHKDQEACELFYKQLKQGLIEPLEDYLR